MDQNVRYARNAAIRWNYCCCSDLALDSCNGVIEFTLHLEHEHLPAEGHVC